MDFSTLVFDFNGTIIDDLDLCLDILNKMLRLTNHPPVSKEKYLKIFTFPIFDYYVKAGFDLGKNGKDSFEKLAVIFDTDYQARFKECQMFSDVLIALKKYKGNKRLILLSATKLDTLYAQLKSLNITNYFDAVIGIKDIYGASKLEEAKQYFSSHPYHPESTLFIGDTLHDQEVGKSLLGKTALIYRGHQSKEVLLKGEANYLLPSLEALTKVIS